MGEYLKSGLAICSTIGKQGFTPEEVKLRLFQFSLKDRAKQWFSTLPSDSIRTWDEMQRTFLEEYYPMSKTSEARNAIKSFSQHVGETFHEAFKRFNEMLRMCPHHDIPKWDLVKNFYDGLVTEDQKVVFACSGGTFLTHDENYEWNFLETLSKGLKIQASADRSVKPHQIKVVNDQPSNERFDALEKKIDMICQKLGKDVSLVSQVQELCEICGDMGHVAFDCPMNFGSNEEVNQIHRERNMNSNTYHPGLRNHPNFRYGNPANQMNPNFQGSSQQGGQQQFQPRQQNFQGNYQRGQFNQGFNQGGYQQGIPQQQGYSRNFQQGQSQNQGQASSSQGNANSEGSTKLDEILGILKGVVQEQEVQGKTVGSLTQQVGQLAEEVAIRRPGKLPSDTTINPQHQGSSSKSNKNAHVNEEDNNTKEKNFVYDRDALEEIRSMMDDECPEVVMAIEEKRPPWTVQVESLPDHIDTKLKPSLEESPKVELKELPKHLKYAFLGEGQTLPVIIASNLQPEQEQTLVEVLSRYKSAIGWTIADLKGISPSIVMHKIITDPDVKPSRDAQRRLNPNMREVVKKEVLKWLDAGIIYPISDSTWVSPTQTVPKKSGIQVVKSEDGEQIATRPVTGWRVCIDYRKLNAATSKDHFPLPFIDQIVEKLSGQKFYCFLDGYSGYNQIAIHPEDQQKTTFTCPYGTFAFRRMPFRLCNAPAIFQRCMMSIFSDMVGESLEIFKDDFSIFGHTFEGCLVELEKVLKRCTETNLVLSWEKSHFMVKEGIVLGHVISQRGIEVDRAKVQVISTLPPPTNVKGVRSFLGHAGFYRRFIKDFSAISKPLFFQCIKTTPS
ncbi:putative nucleotidyltransferase, Ribonuclease H [Helianthus annuus]|uniref:Nucleotidyltransferase, Ribonuclease H n=1 Tax=Helianthus annuus TaxID=4232 RepID=A0A9K3E0B5_HELAN|nr:putative nucleotidyltransferase, Ribonuclease H [Helianthus annuus]